MVGRLAAGVAAVLLLVQGAAAAPKAARAAPAEPRVVLGVDGVGETRNLPVLLAERLGYFKAEGVTVTLVDSPGSPTPGELMADGRADGAVAFYHHTFMSQADDHMVTQAVVLMGVTPGLKLMVASRLREQVKRPQDLRGLRIFTGGPNSGKTTSTNWLVTHAGLTLRDYTPLPPTKAEKMARALTAGAADAVMAHEPDATYYASSGAAFQLADLATPQGVRESLGTVFPSTALYMPKAYVAAHPATVQRLVNACLRAMRYIESHDAKAIAAVLPPKVVAEEGFMRALEEDKAMFAGNGRMPEPAARAEWQAMSALTPKYGRIDFPATFTNVFVERAGRGAD